MILLPPSTSSSTSYDTDIMGLYSYSGENTFGEEVEEVEEEEEEEL